MSTAHGVARLFAGRRGAWEQLKTRQVEQKHVFGEPRMNEKVVSFPIKEYWKDVGHLSEYEQAIREYGNIFDE